MGRIPAQAIDAMLWRGYRAAGSPLRLAVLIDNWTTPNWMFEAIGTLAGQPGLELASILRPESGAASSSSPASPIFDFLHRKSRTISDSESPSRDVRGQFPATSCLDLAVASDGSLSAEARTTVASTGADILI